MAPIPKIRKAEKRSINGGKHTTGESTQKASVARLLLIAPSLSKLLSVKVEKLNRNRSEGAERPRSVEKSTDRTASKWKLKAKLIFSTPDWRKNVGSSKSNANEHFVILKRLLQNVHVARIIPVENYKIQSARVAPPGKKP